MYLFFWKKFFKFFSLGMSLLMLTMGSFLAAKSLTLNKNEFLVFAEDFIPGFAGEQIPLASTSQRDSGLVNSPGFAGEQIPIASTGEQIPLDSGATFPVLGGAILGPAQPGFAGEQIPLPQQPVQKQVIIQQPAPQQPIIIQQPAQKPVIIQQPAPQQQPVIIQQPAQQTPVIIQQPAAQQPVPQQPIIIQQPTPQQQPVIVQQPPQAVQQPPANVSQQVQPQQTVNVSQPVTVPQTVLVQQPSSQPATVQKQIVVRQPVQKPIVVQNASAAVAEQQVVPATVTQQVETVPVKQVQQVQQVQEIPVATQAPVITKGGLPVTGAGDIAVKDLPRTGLPVAAIALVGLVPFGLALKRVGGVKKQNDGKATFIWQQREFQRGD